MSEQLQIIETGEVIETMTTVEAERITSQIANHLDRIADSMELVMPLIAEAMTRGAWQVLGYTSPQAYTSERFAGSLTRLPIPVRRALVAELSDAGMSTRAIAPIIGKSKSQVDRDQVSHCGTPAPEPEVIADPEPEPFPEWTSATAALNAMTDTTEHGLPKSDTINGLDGKSYQRPIKKPSESAAEAIANLPPARPKRKPITDAFWEVSYDLDQLANKLHKLTADDRFNANRKAIAEKNLHSLKQTASTLAQVLAAIETN